jgi:hypothetical protein
MERIVVVARSAAARLEAVSHKVEILLFSYIMALGLSGAAMLYHLYKL